MIIYNITDKSKATVVTVVNDTTLTTTALVGTETSDLTWAMGDEYVIYLAAQATTLVDAGTAFPPPGNPQNFETTVAVGMTIYNETDNSEATVVTVDSDTELTTTALVARPGDRVTSDLTWAQGDTYWIYQGPLIPGGAFDGTGRMINVRGSAHANDIGTAAADRAPDYCADCHDPHSLAADCTDCHTSLSAIPHPAAMAQVDCVACHNGDADLDIGWADLDSDDVLGSAGDMFTVGAADGAEVTAAVTHYINRTSASCQGCHYVEGDLKTAGSRGAPDVLYTEDNPWGLDHQDNL
jgi:mono/diheme cytochrome c family protein